VEVVDVIPLLQVRVELSEIQRAQSQKLTLGGWLGGEVFTGRGWYMNIANEPRGRRIAGGIDHGAIRIAEHVIGVDEGDYQRKRSGPGSRGLQIGNHALLALHDLAGFHKPAVVIRRSAAVFRCALVRAGVGACRG